MQGVTLLNSRRASATPCRSHPSALQRARLSHSSQCTAAASASQRCARATTASSSTVTSAFQWARLSHCRVAPAAPLRYASATPRRTPPARWAAHPVPPDWSLAKINKCSSMLPTHSPHKTDNMTTAPLLPTSLFRRAHNPAPIQLPLPPRTPLAT